MQIIVLSELVVNNPQIRQISQKTFIEIGPNIRYEFLFYVNNILKRMEIARKNPQSKPRFNEFQRFVRQQFEGNFEILY